MRFKCPGFVDNVLLLNGGFKAFTHRVPQETVTFGIEITKRNNIFLKLPFIQPISAYFVFLLIHFVFEKLHP